ncbi:MAG: glycosyltransferase family 4 protein [Burkholderiales bacterium]|nr:glycosyltransferase family 4 protein [Burkholderiales bacterium]
MRILVVTQYFHPEPFRVNDLVVGLRDRGHEVTVLTGMPNYPEGRFYPGYDGLRPAEERFEGMRVLRVPLLSRGRARNWRLALNYLSFAFFASLLGPLRCRGRFDLIFVFEPSPITVGLPALLLGKLKRAPVMLWIQDLWPDTLEAMGLSGPALSTGAAVANFVHRRCDLLLLQSRAFMPCLLARKLPQARLRYLPNWAEELYRSADTTDHQDPLARFEGFRILFAGNIGTAQSFDTILAAAERLRDRRDIHWLIVGDGLMRDTVAAEIRTRGLEAAVHLLGRHPPAAMPAFFRTADALLVTLRPDPVFALTIPSKIQSYLAAGKPIIGALDGEGARVIAESGGGMTCAAGDSAALAELTLRMAELPQESRAAMGARGLAWFGEHFERKRLLDRLEGWMHELTDKADADTDTGR